MGVNEKIRVPTYRLFKEKIDQLRDTFSDKLDMNDTAYGAVADEYGNNIEQTYAKIKDL